MTIRAGDIVGAGIVAVAVLLAAILFPTVQGLLSENEGGVSAGINEEVTALRQRVIDLEERLEGESRRRRQLESRVENLARRGLPSEQAMIGGEVEDAAAVDETLVDALALSRGRFNKGLNSPRPSYLTVLLGEPRADYDDSCQPPTNPRLVERLERRDLGPFAVTMIKPALDSLARVLDRLRRAEPEIYTRLGTAGALCARLVRGSDSAVSTHSWGIAVDLTVAGELDRLGDDGTQFALVLLADFFNAEGWYWGAEYRREDSMHFEVSEQTLRAWVEEGLL